MHVDGGKGGMSDYDKLPPQMRAAPRWLLWKAVPNDDPTKKPRKIPYYADGSPRRGALDSPEDISRLASFDNAQQACESGAYTGLGFALGFDGEGYWQGIDLDNLSEHFELCAMLPDLPGYQENSPSKKGMHAIGYGRKFDSLGSNETGIEAYSSGRYFTVTADGTNNLPLTCLADFVEGRLSPMHGIKWGCNATSSNNPAVIEEAATTEIIKDLRNALLSMPSDDRQLWIKMGLALKSLPEDDGRALWLEWSAKSSKHDPINDARTWEGFDPTRTDYKSVFAEAQRNGWVNPKSGGATLLDLASVFSAGASLPAGALPVGSAPASPMRYKLLSGADLCNAPPMRWMVSGVLPQEGLAALYGASGSGKSFLILDIGYAVAGGDYDWFGRRVTQAPVTYVCLEGEAGTGKRVKAWSLHHKKPVPDALRFITQPFNLLSDDVADLAKTVIAGGGERGLVILDTLNRAAPGADENSSVDMGNLIAAAKRLQNLTGGLVLLVHHTGKDSTKGLRGHSSLYAALDGAIEVTATGSTREWSVAKSKDDVTGDAHPFRLESVSVGEDDDGEPITSCVAVSDDSREVIKKRKPKLCANQKIAYDVLTGLLPTPPDGALIAKPHIDYDNAVDAVSSRMPAEAKDRKGRAKAAISGLVSHDYVVMRDDQLWLN